MKTTKSGGLCGYDAGKKIRGRKRHIGTDTQGNLVGLIVQKADIQDRDGGSLVLASIRRCYPWPRHVFADGGYAGDKPRGVPAKTRRWTLEAIKRSDAAEGFEVPPRQGFRGDNRQRRRMDRRRPHPHPHATPR